MGKVEEGKERVMLKDDGCVFCEADREDLQHFFLGCTFLFQIWCDDYCW